MDQFEYFHLCDHTFKRPHTSGEYQTLTIHSSGNQIQQLVNNAAVLEIAEVRAMEYDPDDIEIKDFYYDNEERLQTYEDVDPGEAYYDEHELYIVDYAKYFTTGDPRVSAPLPASFYEPFLHNRIKWVTKPPLKYQIRVKLRFSFVGSDVYSAAECPKCDGKGWFVDLLDQHGKFSRATGVLRIAQRVVKDLLTEMGSQRLDLEYGSRLRSEALYFQGTDDEMFDFIRSNISTVEDYYLTQQQDRFDDLPDDETLLSLETEEIQRLASNPRVITIRIRIVTQASDFAFEVGV